MRFIFKNLEIPDRTEDFHQLLQGLTKEVLTFSNPMEQLQAEAKSLSAQISKTAHRHEIWKSQIQTMYTVVQEKSLILDTTQKRCVTREDMQYFKAIKEGRSTIDAIPTMEQRHRVEILQHMVPWLRFVHKKDITLGMELKTDDILNQLTTYVQAIQTEKRLVNEWQVQFQNGNYEAGYPNLIKLYGEVYPDEINIYTQLFDLTQQYYAIPMKIAQTARQYYTGTLEGYEDAALKEKIQLYSDIKGSKRSPEEEYTNNGNALTNGVMKLKSSIRERFNLDRNASDDEAWYLWHQHVQWVDEAIDGVRQWTSQQYFARGSAEEIRLMQMVSKLHLLKLGLLEGRHMEPDGLFETMKIAYNQFQEQHTTRGESLAQRQLRATLRLYPGMSSLIDGPSPGNITLDVVKFGLYFVPAGLALGKEMAKGTALKIISHLIEVNKKLVPGLAIWGTYQGGKMMFAEGDEYMPELGAGMVVTNLLMLGFLANKQWFRSGTVQPPKSGSTTIKPTNLATSTVPNLKQTGVKITPAAQETILLNRVVSNDEKRALNQWLNHIAKNPPQSPTEEVLNIDITPEESSGSGNGGGEGLGDDFWGTWDSDGNVATPTKPQTPSGSGRRVSVAASPGTESNVQDLTTVSETEVQALIQKHAGDPKIGTVMPLIPKKDEQEKQRKKREQAEKKALKELLDAGKGSRQQRDKWTRRIAEIDGFDREDSPGIKNATPTKEQIDIVKSALDNQRIFSDAEQEQIINNDNIKTLIGTTYTYKKKRKRKEESVTLIFHSISFTSQKKLQITLINNNKPMTFSWGNLSPHVKRKIEDTLAAVIATHLDLTLTYPDYPGHYGPDGQHYKQPQDDPRIHVITNAQDNRHLRVFKRAIEEDGKSIGMTRQNGIWIPMYPNTGLSPYKSAASFARQAQEQIEDISLQTGEQLRICELGTGTGVVALHFHDIAKDTPYHYIGTDISSDALAAAELGFQMNGLSMDGHETQSFTLRQGDMFDPIKGRPKQHIIMFNPPYYPTKTANKTVSKHGGVEAITSLDGGPDGLDFFRRMFPTNSNKGIKPHIQNGGRIILKMDSSQRQSVETMARRYFKDQIKRIEIPSNKGKLNFSGMIIILK